MYQRDYSHQFLTYKQVCSRYGIGSTTLYRWMDTKQFPAGTKLGPRSRRWNIRDLLRWEAEQNGGDV